MHTLAIRGTCWKRWRFLLLLLAVWSVALAAPHAITASSGEGGDGNPSAAAPDGVDKLKFNNWVFLPTYLRKIAPAAPLLPTATPTAFPTATPTLLPTATPTPSPTPPLAGVTRIEENDVQVSYSGVWQMQANTSASGGAFAVTTWPLSAVEIRFAGDSFAFYRAMGPDFGQAQVSIDGRVLGLLQFNFVDSKQQAPAFFQNLGPGQHVLRIERPPSSIVVVPMPAISVDAVLSPSPISAAPAQDEAVRRLNEARQMVGLPPLKGHLALHTAAQRHAEYFATHQAQPVMQTLGFHGESSALSGYTGFDPTQRAAHFGYTGLVGELGSFEGDPARGLASLLATVYHRQLLFDFGYTDAGYGGVGDGRGNFDVINIGYNERSPHIATARGIYVYPAQGQQHVPTGWNGMEWPDPLPGASKPVGYPISLHIVQPGKRPGQTGGPGAVTAAQLTDAAGASVPVHLLSQSSDPNRLLDGDTVFLIPTQPLRAYTLYTVRVAGVDGAGNKYSHLWQFCTGGE